MSTLSDNKTMTSWKKFLMKVIDDFKDKGYTFNHIAEMHNITIVHKTDMSYDFYNKHKMCAFEWLLNRKFNRDKKLNNIFPQNWTHPINRKYQSYRIFEMTIKHYCKLCDKSVDNKKKSKLIKSKTHKQNERKVV